MLLMDMQIVSQPYLVVNLYDSERGKLDGDTFKNGVYLDPGLVHRMLFPIPIELPEIEETRGTVFECRVTPALLFAASPHYSPMEPEIADLRQRLESMISSTDEEGNKAPPTLAEFMESLELSGFTLVESAERELAGTQRVVYSTHREVKIPDAYLALGD